MLILLLLAFIESNPVEIVLNNKTSFFCVHNEQETSYKINIPNRFTFVVIDGITDNKIKVDIVNNGKLKTKKIKKQKPNYIGLDFGENIGDIKFSCKNEGDLCISYAAFDEDCDERRMMVETDSMISLSKEFNKKICVFNAIIGPFIIRSTFNLSNKDSISILDHQGESIDVKRSEKYVCPNQCMVVYQAPSSTDRERDLLFYHDRSPLLYEGKMKRSAKERSFKEMKFVRSTFPDIFGNEVRFPIKYTMFMVVVIIYLMNSCFWEYFGNEKEIGEKFYESNDMNSEIEFPEC